MRRGGDYKRQHKPDFLYGRVDLGRFINYIMQDGKKSIAETIVYSALEDVKKSTNEDPLKVFDRAMKNASPLLELMSRRIGGANYQIPQEVHPDRQFVLASRWIIDAARSKKGKSLSKRLAEEIIAASKNEGSAIKKKQDTHKMAEANRAFAHFAK